MRIGIITIHRSPSYGGSLQAFALYKYLEKKGHDVEVIDLLRPTHKKYRDSYKHFHSRASFVSKVCSVVKSFLHLSFNHYDKKTYNSKFESFNKSIKLSKTYRSVDDLYNNPPIYDVYVTGSDQVWNPNQPYIIEPYFLTFVHRGCGKKISYAASVGLSILRPKEKKLFKHWIEQYDRVSVREQSIKEYLATFVNKSIARVADPTYLLDRHYWKSIAHKPNFEFPYILLFELGHNIELVNFCKRLSQQSGHKLIILGQKEPKSLGDDYMVVNDAGPLEFIGFIEKAEMVITDSFHGTIFSIIMETQNFFSYIAPGNKKGSRIIDLLFQHNISDHLLIPDLKQTWAELSNNHLNKQELDRVFDREQSLSRRFLDESLIP